MTGIENAIRRSGSASALGAQIGVSKMAVSLWRRKGIPAERVLSVFEVTGVTPHELRPDLYPNQTDGLPKQEP
ncbi:YdaS family helix-turn-helix protein [Enterobacter bugandensis]|jgi:DNA-binding transcriptional regulator YdaS (Cro superfamily)|uniref:Helix-turn-helix domain-containing protein n=1 Tax=Enterobacter asburiae TaxID=61645 RepID=A0A7W3DGK7_ENTAS|nr:MULTISPECIES: YdaS family helix-turn-helix protein [Enterobacter]MBA7988193.1 helix-turn-helix domain-containing protein [Enterobacter asburiae]MBA8078382.1 helix-turn-helix domain-containing protein [Enterobacter asburiae]MCK6711072.1 helix-turn-helix domain-containing protein [Enterobacter cloacae]MDO2432132.1 YdaS family helix-turn-helix protein [Enterobacter bugandensis]MDO2445175.1 YdaS family helix-turn-helix protein [Enterobacter bugandensis]